jgi:pyruvate, orthophosphate dikinase
MIASKGILTSRGGATSHAAVVARQFGKPAVVGCEASRSTCGPRPRGQWQDRQEGDWLSLDGTSRRGLRRADPHPSPEL